MLILRKNTIHNIFFNYLRPNKDILSIFKRDLQRQTFKTKEKVKRTVKVTDLEKAKNVKIQPPSIFALPMDVNVTEPILQYEAPFIANLIKKNEHFKYSFTLFQGLLKHLEEEQATSNKELYFISDLAPDVIKTRNFIKLTIKDDDYEVVLKIINTYNINVFYNILNKKYYYLSQEGAYEIDKFLQLKTTKIAKNEYNVMSFAENFFKNEIKHIIETIRNKKEKLLTMKKSSNNEILLVIYNKLLDLKESHLRIFIRCIVTLLFKESDIKPETEEENKTILHKDKPYYKLIGSYGGIIIRLGEMFIESYFDDFKTEKSKENLQADGGLIYKEMAEMINYVVDQLFDKKKLKSPKDEKAQEKTTLAILSSTQTLKLDTKLAFSVINMHYNRKHVQNTNISKKSKKMLGYFVSQQLTKIFGIIGEELLCLLEKVIYINKEDESALYINSDFYWTTKQSGKYPFFGIKQVTVKDLENIDENKNKFIYNAASFTYNQPMMNYSSKYHLENTTDNFTDQLQESSNSYVCKLNIGVVTHFLKAISYFNDRQGEINEGFLKYLLPKDTDLNILKNAFPPADFEKLINFICDLSKLSYKEFVKNTKIVDIKALVLAIISYKLEAIQVIRILGPLLAFHCWYPRVWADARGRQYPYEMPLNITKSPKWRSLFNYVTYFDNAENTQKYLIKQEPELTKYTEEVLNKKIYSLEEDLLKLLIKKS